MSDARGKQDLPKLNFVKIQYRLDEALGDLELTNFSFCAFDSQSDRFALLMEDNREGRSRLFHLSRNRKLLSVIPIGNPTYRSTPYANCQGSSATHLLYVGVPESASRLFLPMSCSEMWSTFPSMLEFDFSSRAWKEVGCSPQSGCNRSCFGVIDGRIVKFGGTSPRHGRRAKPRDIREVDFGGLGVVGRVDFPDSWETFTPLAVAVWETGEESGSKLVIAACSRDGLLLKVFSANLPVELKTTRQSLQLVFEEMCSVGGCVPSGCSQTPTQLSFVWRDALIITFRSHICILNLRDGGNDDSRLAVAALPPHMCAGLIEDDSIWLFGGHPRDPTTPMDWDAPRARPGGLDVHKIELLEIERVLYGSDKYADERWEFFLQFPGHGEQVEIQTLGLFLCRCFLVDV